MSQFDPAGGTQHFLKCYCNTGKGGGDSSTLCRRYGDQVDVDASNNPSFVGFHYNRNMIVSLFVRFSKFDYKWLSLPGRACQEVLTLYMCM